MKDAAPAAPRSMALRKAHQPCSGLVDTEGHVAVRVGAGLEPPDGVEAANQGGRAVGPSFGG